MKKINFADQIRSLLSSLDEVEELDKLYWNILKVVLLMEGGKVGSNDTRPPSVLYGGPEYQTLRDALLATHNAIEKLSQVRVGTEDAVTE